MWKSMDTKPALPSEPPQEPIGDGDLVEYSRLLIARGSKSFAGAAKLFDSSTRANVYLLYAWCRYCDDVIDGQELGFGGRNTPATSNERRARLHALELETSRCLEGRSREPVFRGLARVITDNGIDPRFPKDLLAGFKMDVEGRQYATLHDLLEYCYCVAGTVGIMMATIMGVRTLSHLRCACDLGIAFQLTNIARDIIDDHNAGRVYLPSTWLTEFGLTPATLAERNARANLARTANRLLDVADSYYRSADHGVSALTVRSAWAVATARSVYSAIGDEIRVAGASAWDRRVSVSSVRKLQGVGEGLVAGLFSVTRRGQDLSRSREGLWTPPALAGSATPAEVIATVPSWRQAHVSVPPSGLS